MTPAGQVSWHAGTMTCTRVHDGLTIFRTNDDGTVTLIRPGGRAVHTFSEMDAAASWAKRTYWVYA